jgi:hypothetical protein
MGRKEPGRRPTALGGARWPARGFLPPCSGGARRSFFRKGAGARHRGVRGRHPDRVGEASDPGSRWGVRAPRPCRWSSDRSGPATTRSVGGGRRSRPWQARAAMVVTACTTPPPPHPQQSASAGVPRQSGSGNRASVMEPAGRIRRVRPDPRGWLPRRPACRGRRTVRAAPWAVALPRGRGWPSDRATKATWGRFPTAEPLFHQARGCRRMTREYRWRRSTRATAAGPAAPGSSRAGAA